MTSMATRKLLIGRKEERAQPLWAGNPRVLPQAKRCRDETVGRRAAQGGLRSGGALGSGASGERAAGWWVLLNKADVLESPMRPRPAAVDRIHFANSEWERLRWSLLWEKGLPGLCLTEQRCHAPSARDTGTTTARPRRGILTWGGCYLSIFKRKVLVFLFHGFWAMAVCGGRKGLFVFGV